MEGLPTEFFASKYLRQSNTNSDSEIAKHWSTIAGVGTGLAATMLAWALSQEARPREVVNPDSVQGATSRVQV